MDARGRAGSLSKIAQETGASKSTIANWAKDTIPSWHYCRGIADAFNLPREYVRTLAGYVDPEDDPYIAEATLTPDEAMIVRAYRTGDREVQAHLELAARVALRLRSHSDESAADGGL